MVSDIEAAAALDWVASVLDERRLERDHFHKLLYYAQGMSYGLGGVPLFEGTFVASSNGPMLLGFARVVAGSSKEQPWWSTLRSYGDEFDGALVEALKGVYDTFGRFGARELSSASRAERPWQRARGDLSWKDRTSPPISNDHIHDYFAKALETGEDAMADLNIPVDPAKPAWLKPFEISVNVHYNSRHPLFSERDAVRLRTELGFSPTPGDWTGFDFDASRPDSYDAPNRKHG